MSEPGHESSVYERSMDTRGLVTGWYGWLVLTNAIRLPFNFVTQPTLHKWPLGKPSPTAWEIYCNTKNRLHLVFSYTEIIDDKINMSKQSKIYQFMNRLNEPSMNKEIPV